MMFSHFFWSNFLDAPADWNDKMTLFLILFSAGLICILCAILLAIYLLKGDKSPGIPQKERKLPSNLSFEDFEEESRLSRLIHVIGSSFKKLIRVFKRSEDEHTFPEPEILKTTPAFLPELPEDDPKSLDENFPPAP